MRIRHKTPTLVSMWMLDVFCCALGCVTLLFLLDRQAVTDAEDAQRRTVIDLDATGKKLAAEIDKVEKLRVKLTSEEEAHGRLSANLTKLQGRYLELSDESRELNEQLKIARTKRDDTCRKLALARDETKTAQAQLDATQTALNAAEKKIDAFYADFAFEAQA